MGTVNGEYWRLLLPGTYDVTVSAENYISEVRKKKWLAWWRAEMHLLAPHPLLHLFSAAFHRNTQSKTVTVPPLSFPPQATLVDFDLKPAINGVQVFNATLIAAKFAYARKRDMLTNCYSAPENMKHPACSRLNSWQQLAIFSLSSFPQRAEDQPSAGCVRVDSGQDCERHQH